MKIKLKIAICIETLFNYYHYEGKEELIYNNDGDPIGSVIRRVRIGKLSKQEVII